MKPEIREHWRCPICKTKDTVALEVPDFSSNVIWCSYGHLTVWDNSDRNPKGKLVYTFDGKED